MILTEVIKHVNLGYAFNRWVCCRFSKMFCHDALWHHFTTSCNHGVTVVSLYLSRLTTVSELDIWKQGSGLWKQIFVFLHFFGS